MSHSRENVCTAKLSGRPHGAKAARCYFGPKRLHGPPKPAFATFSAMGNNIFGFFAYLGISQDALGNVLTNSNCARLKQIFNHVTICKKHTHSSRGAMPGNGRGRQRRHNARHERRTVGEPGALHKPDARREDGRGHHGHDRSVRLDALPHREAAARGRLPAAGIPRRQAADVRQPGLCVATQRPHAVRHRHLAGQGRGRRGGADGRQGAHARGRGGMARRQAGRRR